MVSSILATVVRDGTAMKVAASSASLGPVDEGCRIRRGLEVFFCRSWYFLVPWQRRAGLGVVAEGEGDGEEVMVKLGWNGC